MKKTKLIALVLGCLVVLAMPLASTASTYANTSILDKINTSEVSGLSDGEIDVSGLVTKGLNYLMYAVAVISVVMIIFGGIRYATSGGNAEKVKSAKNTILYAVVGLAVALLALVIVKFVETTAGGAVTFLTPHSLVV